MSPRAPLDWKPSVVAILGKRAAGTATSEDLVEWAVSELVDGLDTPHRRILAGLTRPLYWSEVGEAFQLALEDLGIPQPLPTVSLWRYIRLLAAGILSYEIPAPEGCHWLYRLWVRLDYDAGLAAWHDLDETWSALRSGEQPLFYPEATKESFAALAKDEARKLLCMPAIELIALNADLLTGLAEHPAFDVPGYEVAPGDRPLIRETAAQTSAFLKRTRADPAWGGFLAADAASRQVVETCAFKGSPSEEGVVEIAYFTFPSYEGRGYATAMASALIRRAMASRKVSAVIAHTLPEQNASGRVLTKVGMQWDGEHEDPEDGWVWRWSYPLAGRTAPDCPR